ncbi:MAG TPA: FG-GAP-like repeat-containing protein [Verrucomicrobiae bacterium]|jgi:hypothetical protein|nr:FG-GAP-like repeat-containing protein [Verrucomicrobiae bacterium]
MRTELTASRRAWALFAGGLCAALFASALDAQTSDTAPQITGQPAGVTVTPGAAVTLSVHASGSPAPAYHWEGNAVELPEATNNTLLLTNISWDAAGIYRAIASNYLGTATSQWARVQVVPGFTPVTNDIAARGAGGTGAAWGDFEGSGNLDLFVAANTNLLYRNLGGQFELVTNAITLRNAGARSANWGGAAWADYDNDGKPDLFESTGDGKTNFLYHNEGDGVFTIVRSPVFSKTNVVSLGCAWADFDNDGCLDLYIATRSPSSGGANDLLLHNNGDGTFTPVTNSPVALDNVNSQSGSWCDFNNDGWPDLFVAVLNGARNLLYTNNGNGGLTRVTTGVVATEGGNSVGGAWGDYDNDGWPDLFVGGSKNHLYHNSGNGNFTEITTGVIVNDVADFDAVADWADFDNDGYLDLLITGNKNYLYHNNGDGTFTKVLLGALTSDALSGGAGGSAWGDFNNDGFLDVFAPNYNGANHLYLNNGNSNNWLVIKCEGRVSNRSAIGAKVRVKATIGGKTMWQLREISGGGNYFAQNDPRPHFGLGDATNADVVRIEWPSGIVQELTNVAAKQFLTVIEPAKLKADYQPATGEFHLTVLGGKGLAYVIEQTTNLSSWIACAQLTNQTGAVIWTNLPGLQGVGIFYRAREL